jgi:hypothetical protein
MSRLVSYTPPDYRRSGAVGDDEATRVRGGLDARSAGSVGVDLMAVIDLAERMDAAVLRGDVEGRERARGEFGVGG